MGKLAIVATAEIAPGRMDEAMALFQAHGERCLRDEQGTEQFQVLKPRNWDNILMLYEVYQNDAAFKAHWDGPLVARVKAETEGMLVKLTGTWCDLHESGGGANVRLQESAKPDEAALPKVPKDYDGSAV